MKASPGARSWIAAGVRHELLTRALPALRHHMVAPVSVIRMGLLLLKRQVAAEPVDGDACVQRVAAVDEQVAAVVAGIRSLRDWELSTPGDGITRAALVAQCAGLLRTPFELSGIALRIDDALQASAADEETHPNAAALRYLLLGALSHVHDCVAGLRSIHLEADGPDALRIRATAGGKIAALGEAADAQRAPRALAIDAVALLSLADDLGYRVAIERDTVRFDLRAA